jgi:DNA repair exonuclease SbcCD ATPase subunit
MKIRRIDWRNFGSYGNNTQSVSFDQMQGNFYLVVGSNGAGKSTMSDVIKFGLYGKVDNKKMKDLPNRFNSNLYVRIEVEKNPTTIAVVERGIAPNFFRLFINGVEYDQAGKKNMQEFLEEEILGVPYYVFNNMVSLSINDFKSFINMGVHDKRMIIDRLFGLEVLGAVKWKVRYQIRTMKDEIELIDRELSVLENNIKSSERELSMLNEKLKTAGEEKKKLLIAKIESLQEFISKADQQVALLEEKSEEIESQIKHCESLISEQRGVERQTQTKISLYERGKCPTCEGDLTTDHHRHILEENTKKNQESKEAIQKINESLNELVDRKKKVGGVYREITQKKASAAAQELNCKHEVKKLEQKQEDSGQTQSLQNIIDQSTGKKEEAILKKDKEERKANFYKIIEDIFGDKGVKVSALKKIVPVLNIEIRKVLHDLSMDYRVSFNEEFEVEIQHLGFKVASEQLSTGERKKVDFAVLIALIRLMKTKFAGLNLIYLDEIFSSIDSDGIHHILKVLHKTCRELNLNIFVINHSQLPTEIFDYRVEITKNTGFSNLMIEKIA